MNRNLLILMLFAVALLGMSQTSRATPWNSGEFHFGFVSTQQHVNNPDSNNQIEDKEDRSFFLGYRVPSGLLLAYPLSETLLLSFEINQRKHQFSEIYNHLSTGTYGAEGSHTKQSLSLLWAFYVNNPTPPPGKSGSVALLLGMEQQKFQWKLTEYDYVLNQQQDIEAQGTVNQALGGMVLILEEYFFNLLFAHPLADSTVTQSQAAYNGGVEDALNGQTGTLSLQMGFIF